MNKHCGVGRLANDPELKYTSGGVAYVNVRIAFTRDYKNKEGVYEADFLDFVIWRTSAEYIANYGSKGRMVSVESKVQVREYKDQAGNKRRAVEFVADNIKLIDKPKDGQGDNRAAATARPEAQTSANYDDGGLDNDFNE
jgi:single-strand DNA-binding protein